MTFDIESFDKFSAKELKEKLETFGAEELKFISEEIVYELSDTMKFNLLYKLLWKVWIERPNNCTDTDKRATLSGFIEWIKRNNAALEAIGYIDDDDN